MLRELVSANILAEPTNQAKPLYGCIRQRTCIRCSNTELTQLKSIDVDHSKNDDISKKNKMFTHSYLFIILQFKLLRLIRIPYSRHQGNEGLAYIFPNQAFFLVSSRNNVSIPYQHLRDRSKLYLFTLHSNAPLIFISDYFHFA